MKHVNRTREDSPEGFRRSDILDMMEILVVTYIDFSDMKTVNPCGMPSSHFGFTNLV